MCSASESKLRRLPIFSLLALLISTAALADVGAEVSVTDEPVKVSNYDFGLMNSLRAAQGTFDPYTGAYVPYPAGSSSWSNMTSLNGTYRFSKEWELGLSLPIFESRTIFPTGSITSTSVSIPQLLARYHFGTEAHLVGHVGLSLPYKYRYSNIQGEPSASLPEDSGDAATLSGFAVRTGLGASHSIKRFRFAFDASVTTAIPTDANLDDAPVGTPNSETWKGEQFLLNEGLAYTLSPEWLVNGGLQQIWQCSSRAAGAIVDGSAGRLFSTSLGVGYTPVGDWRWIASVSTPYPFYAYAVNQAYAPSVSVGVTYTGGI